MPKKMSRLCGVFLLSAMLSYPAYAEKFVPIVNGDIKIFIPVKDSPITVDDAYSVAEDSQGSFSILENDSDNGNAASQTIASACSSQPYSSCIEITNSGVANATTDINNGALVYQASANWHGTDTIQYRLYDFDGVASNTANVTITVTSVNDHFSVSNVQATAHPNVTPIHGQIRVRFDITEPDGVGIQSARVQLGSMYSPAELVSGSYVAGTLQASFGLHQDGTYLINNIMVTDEFGTEFSVPVNKSIYLAPNNGSVTINSAPEANLSISEKFQDYVTETTMSWGAISGASEYRVVIDPPDDARYEKDPVSTTSYVFNPNKLGRYLFSVKACNENGCGPESASLEFTVNIASLAQPSASLSILEKVQDSGITTTLSWLPVNGATEYRVVVNPPNGSKYDKAPITQTSHVLNPNYLGVYQFSVKACNSSGCGLESTPMEFRVNSASINVALSALNIEGNMTVGGQLNLSFSYANVTRCFISNTGKTLVNGEGSEISGDYNNSAPIQYQTGNTSLSVTCENSSNQQTDTVNFTVNSLPAPTGLQEQ